MEDSKVINVTSRHIDFNNLCGGNNFAILTDNYNRNSINMLIWAIKDDTDKLYATKAIFLQKKLDKCSDDDDDLYEKLLLEQVTLQKEYADEKHKHTSVPISKIEEKAKRYNSIESSVLMYFLLDAHSVNFSNSGEKNCSQKNAQKFYSQAFGWAERSYEGKVLLDFTDSSTRKAMEKVANDLKDIAPSVVKEIWHQYDEYEEDFLEKYPEKKKKILA